MGMESTRERGGPCRIDAEPWSIREPHGQSPHGGRTLSKHRAVVAGNKNRPCPSRSLCTCSRACVPLLGVTFRSPALPHSHPVPAPPRAQDLASDDQAAFLAFYEKSASFAPLMLWPERPCAEASSALGTLWFRSSLSTLACTHTGGRALRLRHVQGTGTCPPSSWMGAHTLSCPSRLRPPSPPPPPPPTYPSTSSPTSPPRLALWPGGCSNDQWLLAQTHTGPTKPQEWHNPPTPLPREVSFRMPGFLLTL